MATLPSRREATHDRIVEVASRAVRCQGYAGVGVADVMKQAGLTHGGFYAHFASRDAMLVEAIERAGLDSSAALARRTHARQAQGASAFRALIEQYLSESDLAETETGCVVAALASDTPRQSPAVQQASAARVRKLVAVVQRSLAPGRDKGDGKASALFIASTLVGALQLARTLGPNVQGKAVLAATRRALLDQYDA